jgi:hypothetical protein
MRLGTRGEEKISNNFRSLAVKPHMNVKEYHAFVKITHEIVSFGLRKPPPAHYTRSQ